MKRLVPMILVVAIIAAFFVPAASATAGVTLNAVNPLGEIQIQENLPLTSRDRFLNEDGEVDFNGKTIGLSWYSKDNNESALRALGDLLQREFPGVTIVAATALGSPWNNKTNANYNQWAGVTTGGSGANTWRLDAVVFGVAD